MPSYPTLSVGIPSKWMFEYPPRTEPLPLAPSTQSQWPTRPFTIDPDIYKALLNPAVPFTIATIYVTLVKFTNQYNRRRGFKPWSLSKTRSFFVFQQAHNVFLTVYSALTFYGMVYCMRHSLPHAFPLNTQQLIQNIDGLCKLQGPRGLGSAVMYNAHSNLWESKNSLIHLAANGLEPEPTDVGRIWNEGLAWWGWWFYLSKFYEVVDTFIILAKGKRSSTLQTYHHAGAMLSMWAGIRYMSPPIWLFCFANSFIHTCMYFYYTLTTFGIKVPVQIKRTLTTAQIAQFIVGVFFATGHLFVAYDVPVSIAYTVASAATAAASSASSAATEVSKLANSPSISSLATAAATAVDAAAKDWGVTIKRWALRAANAEGPAENLVDQSQPGLISEDPLPAHNLEEIRYRIEYQQVHCLDTSGQVFAILLNVFYLMPLMVLFARFFIKSYILTPAPKQKGEKPPARRLSESASEAARRTSDAVEDLGKSAEHFIGSLSNEAEAKSDDLKSQVDSIRKDIKSLAQEASGAKGAGEVIEEEESKVEENGSANEHGNHVIDSYAEATKEGLAGDEATGVINKADVSELPKAE